MFRKSILVTALSLALLPNVARALGLGGIRAQSALNQPFAGYIDLQDVRVDELDTVKVKLASEEDFAKAGATRRFFLTKLKFTPQYSAGRTVIRVTSNEPIREPFLDFLIEVIWPKGRLIKEYTVLLDPPVTLEHGTLPRFAPAYQRGPVRPAIPASTDTSAFPLRYGPVEQGSNLWRIARTMAPSTGATITQMMMALYRNNQQAFIHGDINKLKVDEILVIPTGAELFALDATEADSEFRAALRGEQVAATPLTDITAGALPSNRLEIAGGARLATSSPAAQQAPSRRPPTEAPGGETEAGTPGAEASDQAPFAPRPAEAGQARVEETGAALGAIQEDLLLVQEAGESTRQETTELRSRIRELEKQLADVQQLLELSNERVEALQQIKLGQLSEAGPEVTDIMPFESEAPAEAGMTRDGETTVAEVREENPSPAEPQPGAENTTGTIEAEPTLRVLSSLEKTITRSPLSWAAPALLALLLGWLLIRQRRARRQATSAGAPMQEYRTAEATAGGPAAEEHDEEQAPEQRTTGVTSRSEVGEFGVPREDTDEVDLLSEADVYLAYGRYRDTEALLQEGIKKSPNRIDIKYKLAEVYWSSGKVQRLEALLDQMERDGDDRVDLDQWKRLNTMLADLKGVGTGPDRPHPAAAPTAEEPTVAATELSLQQESLLHPSFSANRAQQADAEVPSSGFPRELHTAPTRADSSGKRPESMELKIEDLELIGDEAAPSASGDEPQPPLADSDLEVLIEDLEHGDPTDVPGPTPPHVPASPEAMPTFPADSRLDPVETSPSSLDIPDEPTEPSQWEQDSGMWDEVATKMDLARAYTEMGDPDAARVILEEVVEEGTETQRADAKEMMKELS
jgi:pilus assembly protein FimV